MNKQLLQQQLLQQQLLQKKRMLQNNNNYNLLKAQGSDYSPQTSASGSGYGYSPKSSGYGGGHSGSAGYGGYGGDHSSYGGGSSGYGGGYGGGYSSGGYSGGYSPYGGSSVYGSHDGYGKTECPGIPIALLLITTLGIAVLGVILFTKIQGAGRRKRRDLDGLMSYWDLDMIFNIITSGLEEFEEKVDRIAEGEDDGDENSWINRIYNHFSFFNEVGDDHIEDGDMDGLEPPLLDETWGLGDRSSLVKNITANATIEEALNIDEKKENHDDVDRTRRSLDEDAEEESEYVDEETEEKCRVDMWRCLSKVIEGGLHYIDKPEGLMGMAKKTMFKVAFHGGFSNIWGGLMTIPEARHIKKCMNEHTECVSYEILRREAEDTMDPSDPAINMYQRKNSDTEEKKTKRERLIINPDALPEDLSDGSVAYDEDYNVDNQV